MCAFGHTDPDPVGYPVDEPWRLADTQPVRVCKGSLCVGLLWKCPLHLHISAFESLASMHHVLLIGSHCK